MDQKQEMKEKILAAISGADISYPAHVNKAGCDYVVDYRGESSFIDYNLLVDKMVSEIRGKMTPFKRVKAYRNPAYREEALFFVFYT